MNLLSVYARKVTNGVTYGIGFYFRTIVRSAAAGFVLGLIVFTLGSYFALARFVAHSAGDPLQPVIFAAFFITPTVLVVRRRRRRLAYNVANLPPIEPIDDESLAAIFSGSRYDIRSRQLFVELDLEQRKWVRTLSDERLKEVERTVPELYLCAKAERAARRRWFGDGTHWSRNN